MKDEKRHTYEEIEGDEEDDSEEEEDSDEEEEEKDDDSDSTGKVTPAVGHGTAPFLLPMV
ncbi:hypothetical protein BGZ67_004706 [Mortierella alpina]|nr:hypothetical protein BGZ67_004706 [Mortierella alpina]